eukprot:298778-Pyramimonas_sp.AAC.1
MRRKGRNGSRRRIGRSRTPVPSSPPSYEGAREPTASLPALERAAPPLSRRRPQALATFAGTRDLVT